MTLTVRLSPPLNQSTGQECIRLVLRDSSNIATVLEDLSEHFGADFRRHLFDASGRVIPSWCAFVNGRPVQLNRAESLSSCLHDGDELVLLLNVAGGSAGREA